MRCRNCGRDRGRSGCPTSVRPASGRSRWPTTTTVVGADADPRRDRARGRPGSGATPSCCRSTRRRPAALPVGSTPLLAGRPPGAGARRRPAAGSRTTPATRRCPSRTGRSRSPRPARVEFGVEALACASTGNLAGATAAAAAAVGLPAYVFIPADLEPAKVDHALAYGATVVPIDGTYDDVNRLCLEVADETGWGFVNINLRPFYAEGSQDARLRDRRVARLAVAGRRRRAGRLGRDVHARRPRLRGARRARAHRARGRSGSSAARPPAARRSRPRSRRGTDVIEPVREPDTIVRSLAIGNPADGRYAVELAVATGGSIEAIDDADDRRGDPRRRPARGHLPGDGRRRDARPRPRRPGDAASSATATRSSRC